MRAAPLGLALALLLALLTACGAPRELAPADSGRAAPAIAEASSPATPKVDDAPKTDAAPAPGAIPKAPTAARKGEAAATGEVDYSCSTDADCAVKDVGSCCGYYPACVNKDSPTFPEQVKAACAASGRSGICGFPSISGCQCVEGRCTAQRAGLLPEGGPIQ